jgi:hypothetical protein
MGQKLEIFLGKKKELRIYGGFKREECSRCSEVAFIAMDIRVKPTATRLFFLNVEAANFVT